MDERLIVVKILLVQKIFGCVIFLTTILLEEININFKSLITRNKRAFFFSLENKNKNLKLYKCPFTEKVNFLLKHDKIFDEISFSGEKMRCSILYMNELQL